MTSARSSSVSPAPQTGAALESAAHRLASVSDSPRLDAELLLAFAVGRARSSVRAFPERAVEAAAAARFAALVARRERGEPLAYLVGEREFFSLPLAVSPAVLIPRPETELLVELALAAVQDTVQPAVLDVGTGSGGIALAIKHTRTDARVTATDSSAAALAVARTNAAKLGLDVRLLESHWFEALAGDTFDVVVSNPPYVRSADVRGALEQEPRVALDGGADGLDAYRVLFAETMPWLKPRGALLVEHGADQRTELVALAARHGWQVAAAHDDLAGKPRVLVVRAPP